MIKRSRPIDTYLQKIYKVERVSTFSDKKLNKDKRFFKGIVSRDWGALQIILLDRYIVGSISAEGYF